MSAPALAPVPWAGGRWTWFRTPDRRILALSVGVQLALAVLLGHSRDTRLFMATGYLVATGHSPYVSMDLTAVFHHVGFKSISVVGYPPPWPLLLGAIYRGSYAFGHDILAYNFAIKLPVIAATVALAYLVAAVAQNLGAGPTASRRVWMALLLNPFLLYVAAAWGQIDPIAALLSVAALVLVVSRPSLSALVLSLAVCFKPIAAPVLIVTLVYLVARSHRQALRYAAVFLAGAFALYVAPFLLLGWSAAPLRQVNSQFMMTGTMSYTTVVRLLRDPLLLQGHWWLLGLAWIPALAVASVIGLRHGVADGADLFRKSAALVLVFFLARTWLAEPNVVLVLALVLVLVSLGDLDRRLFTALWVIALVFTVFNASPLQLLFVAFPRAMETSLAFVGRYGDATLLARAALVVAWQATGWWIVVRCLRSRPAAACEAGRPHTETPAATTARPA
jgi:hypothetical protein